MMMMKLMMMVKTMMMMMTGRIGSACGFDSCLWLQCELEAAKRDGACVRNLSVWERER